DGDGDGDGDPACEDGQQLCAGGAKALITPTQAHIDGVEETRLFAAPKVQKFNLGGFGIDPLQNFPDPFAAAGDSLTQPAEERRFSGSQGHEDTWVRAMALQQPGADTVLFLIVDAVGAGNVIQENLKMAVMAATGIPMSNILFGQTHSHAGADLQGLWGGVPQDWIQNVLYPATVAAAEQALSDLRPATLEVRTGDMPEFNSYRRPKRIDEDIDSDTLATLLQARDAEDESVIASLLQFNGHPTSINEDPRVPHADYILGAVDYLEDMSGGVALYFNGPIADASSKGSRPGCSYPEDGDYGNQRCKGEGMANKAMGFELDRVLDPSLSIRNQTVYLPVTNPLFLGAGLLGSFNRYYDFLQLPADQVPGIGPMIEEGIVELPQVAPYAITPVTRITIGGAENGLEIVTLPGEATGTFGSWVRSLAAPGAHVMLLGLTQNSFGYIIPEEEFSYVNASGDAGLAVPFTGYEEFVSLGPLTAPLLRVEGYVPLFDADPAQNLPPYLTACLDDPASEACVFSIVGDRIDYVQRQFANNCVEQGAPAEFCALLNPDTPLEQPCRDAGIPVGVCDVLGNTTGGGDDDSSLDQSLLPLAIDAALRGCDYLDPAHCLYPFPNDFYTREDAGTVTGKRINLNILAMPRNTAGKPIDPTEWNRNDGYSPGQMIMAYVPGLDHERTGAVRLADVSDSLQPGTPVQVFEVGEDGSLTPHLIWSEMDSNANVLARLDDIGGPEVVERPNGGKSALLIRPATNFNPGKRYIVALSNMLDSDGNPISAPDGFRVFRDNVPSQIPTIEGRRGHMEDILGKLTSAGVERDDLYLAWDFTVISNESLTGRLMHMRDDAFAALGDAAPAFTIDTVTENPNGNIARRIEGTFTVPSYVVPIDP
ncbi:MAG: hypothetical protein R3352_09435, partial [Salinisphaeraceae bacterium]|nr:hypothetical protein [Salinisphaeraceae bacterium]